MQSIRGFSEWQERAMNVLIRVITGVNMWLLSRSNGRIGKRFLGLPVLLITTIGRSSGEARTTPLFYLREGESFVLVASRGGTSRHPDWYQNIERNPRVAVQIAEETRKMTARMATEEEAQELWPKLTSMFKVWEKFQERSCRTFPVVILSPADEVLESQTPLSRVTLHPQRRVDGAG
jgi:deazaflavin-dependent oxidoreductase (nitroreductase family)